MAKAKVKSKAIKKIVWALDPFIKNQEMIKNTAQSLKAICQLEKLGVEPAFILSPDGFNWSGDFSGAWVSKFEPLVHEALAKTMLGSSLPLLPLKVLVNKALSLRKDVKILIDYTKRAKAKYLVLNTSARTGVSRILLGSFAETALLHAKTPIILFNPEAKVVHKLKKVVFPTDLSKDSKKTYKALIEKAKLWDAEIHMFHKLPDPIEPIVQTGVQMAGGGWVSIYQFLERERKERDNVCEEWAAEARKKGLKVVIHIEDTPGFVADATCDYAKKIDADLIFLASKAGVVSSVLVGSIARQMARHATVPVMIQHYNHK